MAVVEYNQENYMPPTLDEHAAALTRIENLLTEQMDLIRDTNKVVHSIRRTNWITFWLKVILWTAVIVLPFFFIGPLLKTFVPSLGSSEGTVFGFPSAADIQKALQNYRTGQSQ